jgi:hypothetical protein
MEAVPAPKISFKDNGATLTLPTSDYFNVGDEITYTTVSGLVKTIIQSINHETGQMFITFTSPIPVEYIELTVNVNTEPEMLQADIRPAEFENRSW